MVTIYIGFDDSQKIRIQELSSYKELDNISRRIDALLCNYLSLETDKFINIKKYDE